jgi:HPt (histidine-containing phosphotransfer) domain-containing protein
MAAHGLKGVLATVGSARGRDIAAMLEQAAARAQFQDAEAGYARLREHLQRLDEAFVAAGLANRASTAERVARASTRTRSRKRGRA